MSENPFHFNNPTPPKDFLGRRQLVDNIVKDLCSLSGDSHGIVGGRRFGKSSLLRAIEDELVKRLKSPTDSNICVIPVYLSLKAHTINLPGDVFGFALHRIRGATSGTKKPPLLFGGPVIELGLPEYTQTDPLPISLQAFEAAMKEILGATYNVVGRTPRIVLLIDEIERVMEFSWAGELFGNLRSLVYDSDIRDFMRLVLAGSEHYLDIDERGSRLFNAIKATFLEAFDSDSVKELVGRADGIDPVVAQEVVRQGGGHPFIIQHILHYLVETGLRSATLNHVKAEVRRFRLARRADLDGWLDAIGEEGRRVYYILRQSTDWMTLAEVMKVTNDPRLRVDRGLTALTYHGLIIHNGAYQKFRIHGELFRDWFDIRYHSPPTNSFEVFFSYVEKDQKYVDKLCTHLILLKQSKTITEWYGSKLTAGSDVTESMTHLNQASLILLLVSPEYIASEQRVVEVDRAMERKEKEGIKVIPIRVHPAAWEGTPFSGLQVVPRGGKAVSEYSNLDSVFREVAGEIRGVIESIKKG